MRTLRIHPLVAALAAAIPLTLALETRAEDAARKDRAAATTQERTQQQQQARGDGAEGRKLVGKPLHGANGEQVGEISNVLMKDGKASAVLVDVGGFLGIGEKTVAIPIDDLRAGPDRVTASNLTKQRAEGMPKFDARPEQVARLGYNDTYVGDNSRAGRELSSAERQFLRQAAQDGVAEIRLGYLAQEKGQSEEVKKLGGMLVRDHSEANRTLQRIAAATGVQLPTEPGLEAKREIDRLAKLSGQQFDAAFLQHARKAHQRAVDLFQKEARSGKDDQLQAFAENTLPALKEHLQHAQSARQAAGGARGEGRVAGTQDSRTR